MASLFPSFTAEVRAKIWEFAVQEEASSRFALFYPDGTPGRIIQTPQLKSAIVITTRESRAVASNIYTLQLAAASKRRPGFVGGIVYLSPEWDTFVLDIEELGSATPMSDVVVYRPLMVRSWRRATAALTYAQRLSLRRMLVVSAVDPPDRLDRIRPCEWCLSFTDGEMLHDKPALIYHREFRRWQPALYPNIEKRLHLRLKREVTLLAEVLSDFRQLDARDLLEKYSEGLVDWEGITETRERQIYGQTAADNDSVQG